MQWELVHARVPIFRNLFDYAVPINRHVFVIGHLRYKLLSFDYSRDVTA